MTPPIRQPIPIKKRLETGSFSFSPRQSSPLAIGSASSESANFNQLRYRDNELEHKNGVEYTLLESDRTAFYGLDLPKSDDEAIRMLTSEGNSSFSKKEIEDPDFQRYLPYQLETLHDKARYLTHIVSHLYIAVKSMDIQGTLSITAKDLESAKVEILAGGVSLNSMADSTVDVEHPFYDEISSDEEDSDEDNSDDEEMETGRSTPVDKTPAGSAAIISARHWSIELKTLLQMGFPVPVLLRASLVKVFYAICLSQGQQISTDIFLEVLQKLLEEKKLLEEYGLQLDWELALDRCIRNFPHENSLFDDYDKNQFKRLLNICFISNPFFESKAVPIIFDRLLSNFSTANASLAMSCLYGLLPMNFEEFSVQNDKCIYTTNDVRYYIPSLFHIWSSVTRSENVDLHLVALLSRVSEYSMIEAAKPDGEKVITLGPYGIFDETQFVTLVENLLSSLNIGAMKQSRHPSTFYQSFANLVVFSIVGNASTSEKSSIQLLKVLLNSLRSFVHPSNTGSWTSLLSKLVQSIVSQYHKRLQMEKDDPVNNITQSSLKDLPEQFKLNQETHFTLVQIILPLIQTGIHSKKDGVVNQYISSLSLLCLINPEPVLDAVLIDCYSSLESVTSSHRLRAILKELAAVMRYMVSKPVYRVHVMRILTEILPAIDSNDLVKTIQTLHVITTTATFIPFADLSKGKIDSESAAYDFTQQHLQYLEEMFRNGQISSIQGEKFIYDPELEKYSLYSSTCCFKEFLRVFSERLFLLLENLPDPQKTHGLEAKLVTFIPRTFLALVESLSDDYFNYLCEQVFNFVNEKVLYTLSDCVGNIIGALVKRDPKTQFPKFLQFVIDKIKEEITENGAGSLRGEGEVLPRDQPLFWYTIIFSSIIANSGDVAMQFKNEIDEVTQLLSTVKGPVSMVTSLLYYQLLSTTSTCVLKESRFISPNSQVELDESFWGGFQFSEERFSESNLTFKWHIPSELEVKFAISTFENYTSGIMNDIDSSMNLSKEGAQDTSNDLALSDKLSSDLLTLGHCIAGVAHLFDPSYKEVTEDASKPLFLKRKLDALDVFRKKFGSTDTLSKTSSMSRSPELPNSPFTSSMENDPDNANGEIKDISHDDYVEANQDDEDVILEEDASHIAEIPFSTKLTPSPSHGSEDVAESLNAVLSFKNRKIYYSNYYFGEQKHKKDMDQDYLKLHELRDNIGRFLHKVYKYLIENNQNNTKLFKILLHTYKIFLIDVGSESVLNLHSSSLKFEYLDSIQYIRRLRKPYTRIAFGCMLEKLHKQRVGLFAGSRLLTPLDKLLLTDVIEMSSSLYAGITSSAVSVLNSSMKLLLGSYGMLVKQLITIVQRAIASGDDKVVQHALSVLSSKRFRGKLGSDINNLPLIVSILHDCMLMESNALVPATASDVFTNIINRVKIPSSVCDIKEIYVDSIRPPDDYADFEVKSLKAAKEKKRKHYLESLNALTEQLLNSINPSKFWKLNYFNLSLLINIQGDMEVALHPKVLETLTSFTIDTHPSIFRLCLKGASGILTKIRTLSFFDYDLKRACTEDHNPSESSKIDTKPSSFNDGNFKKIFKKEMSTFDDPQFFIDNKSNFCWLFWGEYIHVVNNHFSPELRLRERELLTLNSFGSKITKDWIKKLLTLLIQEAENDGGFHTNDVRLVSMIVHLTAAGMTPNFAEDDWFEIIESLYVPDDKDSHLVVCEVMAGLLVSKSHTTLSFALSRDKFVSNMLSRILKKDMTLETRGIWIVFSWWVPGNADIRRFPLVSEVLLDFKLDKLSDSSFSESSQLMMVKHLVASTSFRFSRAEELIDKCFEHLDHPYQLVREQVSSLLTALFMISAIDPYSNCDEFIKANDVSSVGEVYFKCNPLMHNHLINTFDKLLQEKPKLLSLSVQDTLKTSYIYTSRSILKFLRNVLMTSSSAGITPYLSSHILPFLFGLCELREVCMLAGIFPQNVLVMLSYIPFRKDQLDDIVEYIVSFNIKETAWHNLQVLGLFIQMFYLKQYLALSTSQQELIFEFVLKLLFHEQPEVRETAAKILTSIIHIWGEKDVDEKMYELLERFTKILTKNKKRLAKDKSSENSMRNLHGATLGLGAMVEAFPYISPIPRWLPLILTTLANKCSNISGNSGKTAKEKLSKFKKNRQDTWHIDSKFFTYDELQDLEGVLWTSYFV